jgi:protein-S-isoprenylcysteine O-methyltransferase Ste14
MILNPHSAITYAWEAVAVVWLAALPFAKPSVRSQPVAGRILHLLPVLLGFTLLGSHYLAFGWLGQRFVPAGSPISFAGLALTVIGCAFAIWARMVLGGNWSGRTTVKQGHQLIVSGPYRLARHPIYSGLLLACMGTALVGGEWRCVLGIVFIAAGFLMKIRSEEQLMLQAFPQDYPRYRHCVKALIPGVF